ncbi:MAG: DUF2474 domain-containing protein [Hyphomicrobiales bacterium]
MPEPPERPLKQRLMWFAALYAAGALVTIVTVYTLRAALFW